MYRYDIEDIMCITWFIWMLSNNVIPADIKLSAGDSVSFIDNWLILCTCIINKWRGVKKVYSTNKKYNITNYRFNTIYRIQYTTRYNIFYFNNNQIYMHVYMFIFYIFKFRFRSQYSRIANVIQNCSFYSFCPL